MHTPRHPTRSITIMASALLALFLLSFVLGRYGVPLGEVVKILLSRVFSIEQTWTDNMAIAVWNVRLPRILLACLVGCGLSAAGTAYQTVFQNPMAAPDILGASSGACFGAALAILTGQSTVMVTVFAFLASLLSVALVYLVGRRSRGSRVVSLLLAGIMVGSLFSACTSYIKLVADPTNQLPQITYWLMGSLSGTRMHTVAFAAVCMAAGLTPLLLLRWRTWRSPNFNCQFDGVVYAVFVSLGFALWENIGYVAMYGFGTALVRAVTAVPGHACFGVFMGIWYGAARRYANEGDMRGARICRRRALWLPVLIHGMYDFIASLDFDYSGLIFIGFILVVFLAALRRVKIVSRNDRYIG